jgi:nucleoside-diphosphate-sugar epimerase
MPRILITGAAGFLGSHLCDRFIREGYEVVAMDNLITGDLRNIEHFRVYSPRKTNKRIKFDFLGEYKL